MKRSIFLSMLAAVSVASSLPVYANDSFVPSNEAMRNAHLVNKGMHWYTSLEEAQVEAKKTGKLVFWLHILGTLEGATWSAGNSLRAVSLSKDPAYSELKSHFVLGYRNIMGEPYAGNSGIHKPNGNAVDTTNGAGAHNIQMFVMNPDGTVVHCMPGFWNAQDLVGELQLGRKLNDLYNNHELSPELKAKQYARMQQEHIRMHSYEMAERSKLQGFDAKHEAHKADSDFIKDKAMLSGEWGAHCMEGLKTTDVVMHERMAKRPFVSYGNFDVAQFSDYGTDTYDKHEDSMDENGQHIASEGPMKFEAIKNAKSLEQARREAAMHPAVAGACGAKQPPQHVAVATPVRTRASYVKTYGVIRRQ